MRLLITYNLENDDLFVQGEWVGNNGFHTRRITEDMPADIKQKTQDVIDWANLQEGEVYIPNADKQAYKKRIEQEIGKLRDILKIL